MLLRTARSLACSLALAPLLAAGIELDRLKIGDRVSDRIEYGRRTQLVLPKGQWQLAVKRERRTESDIEIVDLFFHEIVDNTLTRTIYLTTNKYTGSGMNMWLDEPCKSKSDSYWLDERTGSIYESFCVRVGFLTGVVNGASGELQVQPLASGVSRARTDPAFLL